MPFLRLLRVKALAQGGYSLACGFYYNLVLFEAYGRQPEMACFSDRMFHARVLYREVLVSLESSALSLVISRKKILRLRFLNYETREEKLPTTHFLSKSIFLIRNQLHN